MDDLTPRERLLGTLAGRKVDRAPVICPGGMMNSAVVEIMESAGHSWPAAHQDQRLMTALASDVQAMTGFENYGLPFCMTIEPEALGSEINMGSLSCEPKIAREAFASSADFRPGPEGAVVQAPRGRAVLESLEALSKSGDIPAIGSLTGPISSAASLVEPAIFLKQLRKDPESAHKVLAHVSDQLAAFGAAMIESGAAAIAINDPTATGEILGPKMFESYAVVYINRIVDAIRRLGAPVIVHICGDVRTVVRPLAALRSQALSFDAMVDLAAFKAANPSFAIMGNLSTYLLELGEPEKIARVAERLALQGVDICSPACGLGTATPLGNIVAFTQAATAAGARRLGPAPADGEPVGLVGLAGPARPAARRES
jgi:[methyl-Co(III) methanol-specific corrinoid protein]:coenzyme M methyltransferase